MFYKIISTHVSLVEANAVVHLLIPSEGGEMQPSCVPKKTLWADFPADSLCLFEHLLIHCFPSMCHFVSFCSSYLDHCLVSSLTSPFFQFPGACISHCCSVAKSCLTLCDPADCSTPGFTISQSLLKLMFIEWVMPPNHLLLCLPLPLRTSIFPSIKVFSNELALCISG